MKPHCHGSRKFTTNCIQKRLSLKMMTLRKEVPTQAVLMQWPHVGQL